jgi:hypothetical protein
MQGGGAVENPNDATRRQILEYFYERNAKATSRHGKKGSAVRISDVKRELKALHGLSQQQVMANLTYLMGRRWVQLVNQEKSVSTARGTTIPSVVTSYEISALGIELIEGGSIFQPKDRFPGVNIQASGSSVVTFGDGNLVNVRFEEAADSLTRLREAFLASDRIDDREKLNVAVDIDTITSQLAKADPDRSVVASLWAPLARAADVAGLTALAIQAATLLAPLIR